MFEKSYSQKKGDIAAARGTRLGIRERNPLVVLPNVGRDRVVRDWIRIRLSPCGYDPA